MLYILSLLAYYSLFSIKKIQVIELSLIIYCRNEGLNTDGRMAKIKHKMVLLQNLY